MNPARLHELLACLWAAFGLYWVVSAARGTHATKSGEASAYRLFRIPVLALIFILLLTKWLRIGPLAWRFIPDGDVTRGLGLALTVIGIATAVWARRHLGRYWSDKVVLKVDHKLIRSGPYTYMRHPIYSGVLLGVAGTALAVGEWRGVLAFAMLAINYSLKARKEERLLSTQFAQEFEVYKRHSGFLIPRFGRR